MMFVRAAGPDRGAPQVDQGALVVALRVAVGLGGGSVSRAASSSGATGSVRPSVDSR
ncbi:hypothetical protein [Kitasatospora fiedleri]|uniref:hypothetical protein n=1 Tax=Kitasatospora fiedleri TaxID=2991545 RepID=UPI002989E29E|nr:hypothetical protein [Kitasatospora fiedleri]